MLVCTFKTCNTFGSNRTQAVLFIENIEQIVSTDNEVRLIDAFVESIKIVDFGFDLKKNTEGIANPSQRGLYDFRRKFNCECHPI